MAHLVLAVVLAWSGPSLQAPDLAPVAALARKSFEQHDFKSLFRGEELVRLRLPRQRGGGPIDAGVAAATLSAFTRRFEELEVAVVGAAVLDGGRGYVELRRRFRLIGLAEEETQRILISAQFRGGEWRVAEVWVVGP